MKSSSKIFGVLLAGCLMFATSGCVVMDPAEEADYVEAEWTDELLDDAVEDAKQDAEEQEFEALDEDEPEDFPDPFNGGGTGGTGG